MVFFISSLFCSITSESLNPEQSIIQINRKQVDDMFHDDNSDMEFFDKLVYVVSFLINKMYYSFILFCYIYTLYSRMNQF